MPKNILVFSGGSSSRVVAQALRRVKNVRVQYVSPTADDGGNTGKVIRALKVTPMGDALKLLAYLSPNRLLAESLLHRFVESEYKGEKVGNLLCAGIEKQTRSFILAVRELERILAVPLSGTVLPATDKRVELEMVMSSSAVLRGEHLFDEPPTSELDSNLLRIRAVPALKPNPAVLSAIKRAHYIIMGPGDLYASVFMSFLLPGVKTAVRNSRAKKIFIANQTVSWPFKEYQLSEALDEVRKNVIPDVVLVDVTPHDRNSLSVIHSQSQNPLVDNVSGGDYKNITLVRANLRSVEKKVYSKVETAKHHLIGFDTRKLGTQLQKLIDA